MTRPEAGRVVIEFDDFQKVEMRVGRIVGVARNEKAARPAYALIVDFGELGLHSSSAQLTGFYEPDDLQGKLVVAVTNLPPKRVAGVKSEVLILAAVSETAGLSLLMPDRDIPIGTRIA